MDTQYTTDNPPIGYQFVLIPQVGMYPTINHQTYVILSTNTFQEKDGEITTLMECLPVDDEGNELGKDPIEFNIDLYDITF